MTSPIEPQALYEIALTFSSHLELERMLTQALQAFVEKLGAQAGAIFRVEHGRGPEPTVSTSVSLLREAHESDLRTAHTHLLSGGPLPSEIPGTDGQLWLNQIPGFGALCLVQGTTPLESRRLLVLDPLLEALGRACQTCLHIEEGTRQEEARMMADMLAVRTRELAARTRQLDAALQRARDVSRLKEELLASLSHELRTPLNAVLGLAEALQESVYGPLTEGQAESIQVIESSGRKLLALLTDIMDFARIGAGQMDTTLTTFEASQVAQIAARRARDALKAKNQRVALDEGSGPSAVLSDAGKCQRIVDELLANAIKFTPDGGMLGIDVTPAASGDSVGITVWDTGCGIAENKLELLFEPFVQGRGGLKRRHGGTGLGLALSSRFARLIGAPLSVTSVEGKGSQFTLSIPTRGPRKVEVFGDLNCPFSYTLNAWIEQARLGHLVAWRGVEHMPDLDLESAEGTAEQRQLDEELARVMPRCEEIEIRRPIRRSNTRAALCVLKHIEETMPARTGEARKLLFHAIWVEGRDISTLATVQEVLSGFGLEGYTVDEAHLSTVEADTQAWRSHEDPRIPTVLSRTNGTQHRGLGHRALLHQFLDEELGFVGRAPTEEPSP